MNEKTKTLQNHLGLKYDKNNRDIDFRTRI